MQPTPTPARPDRPVPPGRWLELSVRCDVEAVEAVSEVLGRHAAGGTVVRPTRLRPDPADEQLLREDASAPYEVSAYLADEAGASAVVETVERALWHLQAFGLRPVDELRLRPVEERDWTEAWREGYLAQRVGRIVIVPSWLAAPIRPGELEVRIDPGMAFGTGLHPTTRGCLALLERLATAGALSARVLDVGSGSGILGLAALRLGAASAVACDLDPAAVEATARNAERNGLRDRLEVVRGSLVDLPGERFGTVLANLVAAVLVELAPRLAACTGPGGTLLASGIIAPREGEVRAALESAGFVLRERHAADAEWPALRLERAG